MARRKAAGKSTKASPRRPGRGSRKVTRKRAASKATRKKRSAAPAPPRKRTSAKARKPHPRAARRPGGRTRKASRPAAPREMLAEEPGETLDPHLAEQARSETALLGRGPKWWTSSLGGGKPGARVPEGLRRSSRDAAEAIDAPPPIPIGTFAVRVTDRAPAAPLAAPPRPDAALAAGHASPSPTVTETVTDPETDVEGAATLTPPDGPADPPAPAAAPPDEEPSRHPAMAEPALPADGIAPMSGGPDAAALPDPAPAPEAPAAAGAPPGVMQVLLGTVARSRADGPGLLGPSAPAGGPLPVDLPRIAGPARSAAAEARRHADPEPGTAARKPAAADLDSLDEEIASSLTTMHGIDDDLELPSVPPAPGPANAPLDPAAPPHHAPPATPRTAPASPGLDVRAGRSRRDGAAARPKPSKSPLIAVLATFNYPLRGLPPPARRIVGWIAASLLLWVPIVWLIAIYFVGK
jgi:hypothetical protein